MLFRKILSGCAGMAGVIAKITLLFLFCALVGLCVVYPLWKFAVTLPSAYTFFVSSIFIVCLLLLILFKIRTYLGECASDKGEKERRVRSLFSAAARIFLMLFGIVIFLFLLYNGSRAAALSVLAITLALYGILSFGSKKI